MLPAHLAAIIAEIVSDLDLSDPRSVSGECHSVSMAVAEALRDEGCPAAAVMAWAPDAVPAEIEEVLGDRDQAVVDGVTVYAYHTVVTAEIEGHRWTIDMTAAQYRSTLGWDGPRMIRGDRVY